MHQNSQPQLMKSKQQNVIVILLFSIIPKDDKKGHSMVRQNKHEKDFFFYPHIETPAFVILNL